jgi:phosphatidylglycerophosphate synthase
MTSGATEMHAPARARAGGTAAVLLATAAGQDGGAAAAQPWEGGTLLGRLVDQLAGFGMADVTVITRREWEGLRPGARVTADLAGDLRAVASLAQDGAGALVIAQADIVVGRAALAGLLALPTAALTGDRTDEPASAVSVSHSRVTAAASAPRGIERPSAASLGVLKVAAADRPALAAAARRQSGLAAADPSQDAIALLLAGLLGAGVPVRAADVRAHFWARPLSPAALDQAARAHARHDEERARLDSAVKASDGFFTTFFVSPYSKHIARWAARRGFTPNLVTTVSLAIGLLAAAAFATGQRAGLIAGAVLLQIAFTADCVDGQLARYTGNFSAFGAWLDSMLDRTKEYAVYAGLAIGGSGNIWVLAAGALALQTCRHMLELSWTAVQLHALDGAPGPARSDGALVWVKKAIVFPIGERFAAISLIAALFGPHPTFVVLLAWGGAAALYSIAGRLARSLPR